MHLDRKVKEPVELEDGFLGEEAVNEGLHIEEILDRAHEIHRARGGLIGYDLEDWLQAERESIGEISQRERSSDPPSLEIRTPGFKRGET